MENFMTTTSLDAYWHKPPKVEGSLGDDGEYMVTFRGAEVRFVQDGTGALLEFHFFSNEGESLGENAKTAVFYLKDDHPNFNGLDRLKLIADMLDPDIRNSYTFNDSISEIIAAVPGRTGRVRQNTSKGRVYFDIIEIDPSTAPSPKQKQSKSTQLETEADIPF
jgi:hypothetical protein